MIGKIVDGILRKVIPVNSSGIIAIERGNRPRVVYQNFSDVVGRDVLDRFVSGTYVLSPYYTTFQAGSLPPFCLASELPVDVALHGGSQQLFPHLSLIPGTIADEACFSHEVAGTCFLYLLPRISTEGPFSPEEVAILRDKVSQVTEILEHVQDFASESDMSCNCSTESESRIEVKPTQDMVDQDSVEGFIDGMFTETLSRRERSAIVLTLQGQSVDNIALTLGISPHTVRVHMRNAYGKLRVRNRLELFGMFIKRAGLRSAASIPAVALAR